MGNPTAIASKITIGEAIAVKPGIIFYEGMKLVKTEVADRNPFFTGDTVSYYANGVPAFALSSNASGYHLFLGDVRTSLVPTAAQVADENLEIILATYVSGILAKIAHGMITKQPIGFGGSLNVPRRGHLGGAIKIEPLDSSVKIEGTTVTINPPKPVAPVQPPVAAMIGADGSSIVVQRADGSSYSVDEKILKTKEAASQAADKLNETVRFDIPALYVPVLGLAFEKPESKWTNHFTAKSLKFSFENLWNSKASMVYLPSLVGIGSQLTFKRLQDADDVRLFELTDEQDRKSAHQLSFSVKRVNSTTVPTTSQFILSITKGKDSVYSRFIAQYSFENAFSDVYRKIMIELPASASASRPKESVVNPIPSNACHSLFYYRGIGETISNTTLTSLIRRIRISNMPEKIRTSDSKGEIVLIQSGYPCRYADHASNIVYTFLIDRTGGASIRAECMRDPITTLDHDVLEELPVETPLAEAIRHMASRIDEIRKREQDRKNIALTSSHGSEYEKVLFKFDGGSIAVPNEMLSIAGCIAANRLPDSIVFLIGNPVAKQVVLNKKVDSNIYIDSVLGISYVFSKNQSLSGYVKVRAGNSDDSQYVECSNTMSFPSGNSLYDAIFNVTHNVTEKRGCVLKKGESSVEDIVFYANGEARTMDSTKTVRLIRVALDTNSLPEAINFTIGLKSCLYLTRDIGTNRYVDMENGDIYIFSKSDACPGGIGITGVTMMDSTTDEPISMSFHQDRILCNAIREIEERLRRRRG
jgi:hypothetical protein